MRLPFTKMQGAGNDFIVLNFLDRPFDLTEEVIRKMSDRRFGIGCDQLLIVAPSTEADFRMDIYNSDGGKVEMCGNGIRCFAKYLLDENLTEKKSLAVETMAGIIRPEIILNHPDNSKDTLWVKVDMGQPVLEGRDIPVNHDGLVLDKPFSIEMTGRHTAAERGAKKEFRITCVSMGNPHCVIFQDKVDLFPVEVYGPEIENHPFFPNRVNTEFVEIIDRQNVRLRVWERGAGETLACGTGACATGVACVLNGKTDRKVNVHLRGGDLEIFWDDSTDRVYMTGPATTSYVGEIEL